MSTQYAAQQRLLQNCAEHMSAYPANRFSGRGIVICAGGARYFTNAWVCANILRMHGCALPIEFWYLGSDEMTDEMRDLVRPLGVTCVDGYAVRQQFPARILNGWELKPYAIINSAFTEVLLLDADNVPVKNPEYLFNTAEYAQFGAIFWPDYDFQRIRRENDIWKILQIPYRDEPAFESGQIVVDKRRSWQALQITMHLNEYSDFYYRHIHGDKDTFHFGWLKSNQQYAMPAKSIHTLTGTMCQHDFAGDRIFQHRNLRKWKLHGDNEQINDFRFEAECMTYLNTLRDTWSKAPKAAAHPKYKELTDQIIKQRIYQYCRVGYDFRPIELLPTGQINAGVKDAVESVWSLTGTPETPRLAFWHRGEMSAELEFGRNGILHGNWLMHEKMPVVLLPIDFAKQFSNALITLRQPRLNEITQAAGDKKSTTLVLTGYTGELHTQMAEKTVPRMRAYAKKYGYDFTTCNVAGERPAAWYKIAGMYQALQQYERVLWLDSDIAIVRLDADIFAEFPLTAWQGIVEHVCEIGSVPNTGVWLAGRELLPTLETIWAREELVPHGWWEQAALMTELGYVTDVTNSYKICDTPLMARTHFLPATWNHHPFHARNDSDPRFMHISTYENRLEKLNAVLAAVVD